MKKWICIASAVVLLAAVWAVADSGRETLRNPPQEIEMLSEYSSLETWAFRVKDSSGNYPFLVDNDAKVQQRAYKVINPAFTSGTGFDIDESAGNVFVVNRALGGSEAINTSIGPADNTGVTLVLSTPTAATDGEVYDFILADSGATDAFLYAGGIPINNASGTTDACTLDAQGDSITVMADYDSAVSYWIINHRNN